MYFGWIFSTASGLAVKQPWKLATGSCRTFAAYPGKDDK